MAFLKTDIVLVSFVDAYIVYVYLLLRNIKYQLVSFVDVISFWACHRAHVFVLFHGLILADLFSS